ncbi:hypothetical protein EVAR_45417_1 [Eumeta japonica]|uniref:Uncharacterized protein n=1 Tax=Eumeta variegata TaxID=151549 RepID=A0A4C1ZHZ9_EUMVA|nr:hypothetical protein EVAR_45417_1 [Eumeta japonica]
MKSRRPLTSSGIVAHESKRKEKPNRLKSSTNYSTSNGQSYEDTFGGQGNIFITVLHKDEKMNFVEVRGLQEHRLRVLGYRGYIFERVK